MRILKKEAKGGWRKGHHDVAVANRIEGHNSKKSKPEVQPRNVKPRFANSLAKSACQYDWCQRHG